MVISVKRKELRFSGKEITQSKSRSGLLMAVETVVIVLLLVVMVFLPFHFGNEADKINELTKQKEQSFSVMLSRIQDMSREISYLQTVLGARSSVKTE